MSGGDSQFGENDQRRRELDGRGDGQDIVDNPRLTGEQTSPPGLLATIE
jgi:hypothetical protein